MNEHIVSHGDKTSNVQANTKPKAVNIINQTDNAQQPLLEFYILYFRRRTLKMQWVKIIQIYLHLIRCI